MKIVDRYLVRAVLLGTLQVLLALMALNLFLNFLAAIEHVESAVNPFVVPGGLTSPAALRFVLDGDPASGGFATVVTFEGDVTAEAEATPTEEVDAVLDGGAYASSSTAVAGRSAGAGGGIGVLFHAASGEMNHQGSGLRELPSPKSQLPK